MDFAATEMHINPSSVDFCTCQYDESMPQCDTWAKQTGMMTEIDINLPMSYSYQMFVDVPNPLIPMYADA